MATVTVHGFQLRDAILHSTDLVMQVDPGAQAASTSPYGEIYIYNNANAQTLTLANHYYTVLHFTAGLSNEFTAGSNQLVCNQAGVYQVSCIASYGANNNDVMRFAVHLNGSPLTNMVAEAVTKGATSTQDIAITGFVTLAAGDILDLRVECTTGAGETILITHANLNCRTL
jgi:hypothetical protein